MKCYNQGKVCDVKRSFTYKTKKTSMGATALHTLPSVGEQFDATALQHWRGSFVGVFFRR